MHHVAQTACQVAGVGGFERRVSQAFTRTVRGDEVLKHVQTFAEVRGDRRLDDRAVRLGHQTAHTGELANLRCRAAGTGVGHHVNRVERFLIDFFAMTVNGALFGQLGHHHLGDFVAGFAPDVHHLVVALASRHQTGDILLLDLFDFFFRTLNDAWLFFRHQHVVDADRDAGFGGQAETVLQELVGKHHGLFQTALAERHIDQLGDFFFLQRLVDVGERQTLGQDLGEQRAACRGFPQLGRRRELTGFFVLGVLGQAHIDLGIEVDFARIKRALHFTGVGEDQALALAVDAVTGGVVQTQHHVLRRHDGRLAVGREQDVVRGQHQGAGFHLRFD